MSKGYTLSSEAVGGGDAAGGTEGEEGGLWLQHTSKVSEPESHCLITAQRGGTNCPKCFSLPPGGHTRVETASLPLLFTGAGFPRKTPRAGGQGWPAVAPGPRSGSAGAAEIVMAFVVSCGSAGSACRLCQQDDSAHGRPPAPWSERCIVPHASAPRSPRCRPCLRPPAPSQDPLQILGRWEAQRGAHPWHQLGTSTALVLQRPHSHGVSTLQAPCPSDGADAGPLPPTAAAAGT